jgi:ABC-type Na+ efflux pump permease subunit
MDKTDIIIGIIIGAVALAAIVGVIILAFVGRETLHTGNKLVNAGLTLWIAQHLLAVIFGIFILAVVIYGIILYLTHFGFK